jgi:thiol:disulfide interchange protein
MEARAPTGLGSTYLRASTREVLMTHLLRSSIAALALAAALAVAPVPVLAQAPASESVGRKHLYSETADPRADIAHALVEAKREHKRVLLDFGGDWCGDCQVLDIYFHQQPNWDLLTKHFILVHVFIGQMDKNLDLAARYGVPIAKGVPALAVLDEHGNVLYSQKTGDFSSMRYMESGSVTAFLNRWKS